MNRIKNKQTNRLNVKHMAERIRNAAHLPRNPELVNWNEALTILESKKSRYKVEVQSEGKSIKEKKKLEGLQLSLL